MLNKSCLGLLVSPLVSLLATVVPVQAASVDPETQLLRIYDEISGNRLSKALTLTEALLDEQPNFHLAQLIKGDLLLARTRSISTVGDLPNGPQDKLNDLREEAQLRLRAYREKPPANAVPRYLLQLRPDQKTAVVVDTKKSRLYVYENVDGRPRFLADFYITQGKAGDGKTREGDEKTPIGVYHITGTLPRSKLGDFYGPMALPINYPNEWDRLQGRTGHGIWLHGVPSDTYSRAPRASNGCVVLANPDLEKLNRLVQIGLTPVIISDNIEWLDLDHWNNERQSFLKTFESWRADWESLDTEKYLAHYSKKFSSEDMNYAQWAEHKRRVNAGKEHIQVVTKNLSMLRNPGNDDMLVVTFDQDYRSSNLSHVMQKRQYWIRENGQWRILHEGSAG
ncbi:MAG: hypothetical protein EPO06_11400 [Burkholderiaceae bacterium]|nr:MAG: hypothetical protein EPO06_11400 [Burkholderiaceae bacterium]